MTLMKLESTITDWLNETPMRVAENGIEIEIEIEIGECGMRVWIRRLITSKANSKRVATAMRLSGIITD